MPQRRDPFGSALAAIRHELISGQHGPGAPLSIIELARRLRLSPTPVREALAHLAGEGLVQERRGQGFCSPTLDAEQLTDLLDLHRLYVGAALAAPWRAASGDTGSASEWPLDAPDPQDPTSRLFDRVIWRAGNETLAAAYRRVAERLAPVWRMEARAGVEAPEIVTAMAGRLERQDQDGVARLLDTFYDTRRQAAAELVRALRTARPRDNIPDIV